MPEISAKCSSGSLGRLRPFTRQLRPSELFVIIEQVLKQPVIAGAIRARSSLRIAADDNPTLPDAWAASVGFRPA